MENQKSKNCVKTFLVFKTIIRVAPLSLFGGKGGKREDREGMGSKEEQRDIKGRGGRNRRGRAVRKWGGFGISLLNS
jgi:hypothetical protein